VNEERREMSLSGNLGDAAEVSADDITSAIAPRGEARPPTLPEIGLTAFRWVVAVTAAALVLLAGFGILTYPRLEEVERMAGGATAISVHRELTGEWFARIKDLGQLFILTPLLPLLGVILGYIFGREQQGSST
jgi:hypothetical protein